jgi:hypothetical protein
MTEKAREDLKELRTLHDYCSNPVMKFKSVYGREPLSTARGTYEMEVCLRKSITTQAYNY